jgi:hypothetical protein
MRVHTGAHTGTQAQAQACQPNTTILMDATIPLPLKPAQLETLVSQQNTIQMQI